MKNTLTHQQIEQLWSRTRVTDTGCIEWTGGKTHGYGVAPIGPGKRMLVHRIAYMIEHGYVDDSLCVCHSCDNPACVNPEHLWLGTKAENNADKVAKGRQRGGRGDYAGENNGRAKLTEADVLEIRRLWDAGVNQREIGKRFGVTSGNIHCIVNRKSWKNI